MSQWSIDVMILSTTYSRVTPTTIPGLLHVWNPFWTPFWDHSVDPVLSTIPNPLWVQDTLQSSQVHAHPNFGQHSPNLLAITSTIHSPSKTYSKGPSLLLPLPENFSHTCISTGTWLPFIFIVDLTPLPNQATPTCSHPRVPLGLSPDLPIIISTRSWTYFKGTPHALGMQRTIAIQPRTIGLMHFPPPLYSSGFGLQYLVDRLV